MTGLICCSESEFIGCSSWESFLGKNKRTLMALAITLSLFVQVATESCVFLPAAGNVDGTSQNNRGSNGNYWSSSFNNATNAWNLNFNSGNVNMNNNNRRNGMTVRAVQHLLFAVITER